MPRAYYRRYVVPRAELTARVAELEQWRGKWTGKRFSHIVIYFPGNAKHAAAGLGDEQVLIVART